MKGTRIEALDVWKGLTMLSVLHMHTVFWSFHDIAPAWSRKAALLLDVPVYFFITGILSRSSSWESAFRGLAKQVVRLFGTYLAVVSLVGLGLAISGHLLPVRELGNVLRVDPNFEVWAPFTGFPGSIWFLRVFLGLLPFIAISRVLPVRWLLVALVASSTLWVGLLLRPFAGLNPSYPFHLAIALLGTLCGRMLQDGRVSSKSLVLIWSTWGAVAIAVLAVHGWPDPEREKFPPSFAYFVFALPSILGLLTLARLELAGYGLPRGRVVGLLSWCGRNVFELYLVQGFIASLAFLVVPKFVRSSSGTLVALYVAVFLWNVVGTASVVWLLRFAARFAAKLPSTFKNARSPLEQK